MAYPQGDGNLVKRDDCWIAASLLQAADVLLTEAGYLGQPLLRYIFPLPYPFNVLADELAHVHAQRSANYIL